jgi:hypothetical protein
MPIQHYKCTRPPSTPVHGRSNPHTIAPIDPHHAGHSSHPRLLRTTHGPSRRLAPSPKSLYRMVGLDFHTLTLRLTPKKGAFARWGMPIPCPAPANASPKHTPQHEHASRFTPPHRPRNHRRRLLDLHYPRHAQQTRRTAKVRVSLRHHHDRRGFVCHLRLPGVSLSSPSPAQTSRERRVT